MVATKSASAGVSKYPEQHDETPVEIERQKLNYTFEIIKSCIMALITLVAHFIFGPITAMLALLSFYFLTQRFANHLNDKIFDRIVTQPPVPAKDTGVPESLNKLDWVAISKIPGVDAERLKETFEVLYQRVHEGSLEIQENGEWKEIDESEKKLRQRQKKKI